ncbi:MAG: hypothetical protein EON85_09040 [Brevundimonas sp.]|nr:MAG: hypothetical protein EON85_09040 [Brevundimonas sp.]
MTFSITNAAFEGFRVMRRSPVAVVMWGVTYFVCLALIMIAAGGAVMAVISRFGEATDDPAAALSIGGSVIMVYLISIPLSLVAASIIVAATCRAVLTPKKPGFFFMRLGGAELRLMGAYLLVALAFIAAMVILFGIFAAIAGGVAVMAGGGGEPSAVILALFYPLYFGFIFLYVWVSVRLSLLGPITVAEGRFALGRAWAASRGRFWTLLDLAAATIMRWFVLYAAAVTAFCVLMAIGMSVLPNTADMQPEQMMTTLLPLMVIGGVLLAAFAALQFTVLSTPFAVFYREVVAPTVQPEEEPGAPDPRY